MLGHQFPGHLLHLGFAVDREKPNAELIGARDVAFPRLNQLSYWFFVCASLLVLITLIPSQNIRMLWTGYPPFVLNDNAGPTAFYTLDRKSTRLNSSHT